MTNIQPARTHFSHERGRPDFEMKMFLSLIFTLALCYGALVGYVYFFQSQLVYFPNIGGGMGQATPSDIGLAYEDVTFQSSDGLQLHGWFVPVAEARGVLLFMHGNAGTITDRLDSIDFFHGFGFSVFIFDYRGYGRSTGKPDEQGTYRDAEAAWRHLVEDRKIDPGRIFIFGRSLGAAIAAWLASRTNPAALIIESAFTSAPDLARQHYWFLPVGLLARFQYDTQAYLAEVAAPKLIFHGAEDEIIPFAHGQRLFASARQPKVFVELRGGHNDAFFVSRTAYAAALRDFLNEY